MSKLVTCPTCKKKNQKENTTEISRRYYCISCAEELIAIRESKRTDWDLLFGYICETYDYDKPNMLQFAQLKQFRDNGMTDIGIYYTMLYVYDILGKVPPTDGNLGIVPYYYDKAKFHYNKVLDIADAVEQFEFKESNKEVGVTMVNRFTPRKPLTFDTINWGDVEDEQEED